MSDSKAVSSEPQDDRYGVFKAKVERLLWQYAPDEYARLEAAGALANEIERRARPAWDRLVRMRASGIDYATAMEIIAPDLYPSQGEMTDADEDFKYGL